VPGIVVTHDPLARPGVAERFRRQLDASRLRPWYRVDRWVDPAGRVALGRADLGVFNRGDQPVTTVDGRFRIVFQGELYDREVRLVSLAARGVPLTGRDSADLLLAAYRVHGLDGVARLNGSFFFALWDDEARRLVVGGDRYASRPHMYAFAGGRLIVAPEVAGVIAGLGRTPAPSWQGLGEFLALEHPLADRTLLEDVRVFPGGRFLTLGVHGPRWHEYWRPDYVAAAPRPVDDWVEEAAHLYAQAVRRTTQGACCVALSGGTDSRTILACADRADFPLFTFGQPGSADVRLARRVAAARGLEPAVMSLRGDYLAGHADAMMALGEGMTSLFHGHDADGIEEVGAMAPVVVYGMTSEYARTEFAENVLATRAATRTARLALLLLHVVEGRRPLDSLPGDGALLARLAARTAAAIDPATAEAVLTPEAAWAVREAMVAGLAEGLARAVGPTDVDRLMAFNVAHRQRRFTSWGIKIAGSAHEFRKPFDDYDLVDFLLGVPADVRRSLQARVITRIAPDLAAIPRTGTGVALDAGFPTRALAFGRKQLAAALGPGRRQSFADPQALLRTASRPFFEHLLLDPRTLGNGLVRPEGLRRLVEAHMAGRAEAASALCAIATIELWRRRVLGGALLEAPSVAMRAAA
jgi:asparagine synthase (glutamine-hydrolysing)